MSRFYGVVHRGWNGDILSATLYMNIEDAVKDYESFDPDTGDASRVEMLMRALDELRVSEEDRYRSLRSRDGWEEIATKHAVPLRARVEKVIEQNLGDDVIRFFPDVEAMEGTAIVWEASNLYIVNADGRIRGFKEV